MIRINLLPSKTKAKKAVPGKQTLVYAGAGLALGFVLLAGVWYWNQNAIGSLEGQKADLTQKASQLKVQLKEVERFETDKKKFEERIAIVQKLQKNQSVPVHLLDDVSRALPDRVWLSALKEKDGAVTIEGFAFSNADIVMFGNNLKSSKYLGDVAVVESTETSLENQPVFKFTVACKVTV